LNGPDDDEDEEEDGDLDEQHEEEEPPDEEGPPDQSQPPRRERPQSTSERNAARPPMARKAKLDAVAKLGYNWNEEIVSKVTPEQHPELAALTFELLTDFRGDD
jgi:hypothetical protein